MPLCIPTKSVSLFLVPPSRAHMPARSRCAPHPKGINVDGVIVDTDPKAKGTGVAMVIVAKDKRGGKHTISCKGANEECGTPEVLIAEDYMQRGKQIGVVLMQNEVAHDAIVRVAKLSYNAEKLVIYKSSPIRKATDVSPLLYSYLDVLVVNEWEAPIL